VGVRRVRSSRRRREGWEDWAHLFVDSHEEDANGSEWDEEIRLAVLAIGAEIVARHDRHEILQRRQHDASLVPGSEKGSPWEESCGFWSEMRSGWRGWRKKGNRQEEVSGSEHDVLCLEGEGEGQGGGGGGCREREEAKQTASGFQEFTARVTPSKKFSADPPKRRLRREGSASSGGRRTAAAAPRGSAPALVWVGEL
jgi:hypothetical protein